MSAFIISDNHINLILNFIMNQKREMISESLSFYYSTKFCSNAPYESDLLNTIGHELLKHNYLSVNYRYKDNPDALQEDCSKVFNYKSHYQSCSIAQFLKLVDCLDYQCCEVENYKEGKFYELLIYMRKFAYSMIDGYDQSEWAVD